jgi:hypothetical protein
MWIRTLRLRVREGGTKMIFKEFMMSTRLIWIGTGLRIWERVTKVIFKELMVWIGFVWLEKGLSSSGVLL